MEIVKVFNNNASLVLNDNHQEEVVMGSGIGFGLKPGDTVDQKKIEKRFIINDQKALQIWNSCLNGLNIVICNWPAIF